MTDPYSEHDTRQQLIDHRLRLAGWDLRDPTQITEELDIDLRQSRQVREPRRERPYEGHQFVDYALLLSGAPAAVLEAKKTSRDARVGQEQALQYAQNLQRLNGGRLPLVMYSNGYKHYFWDSEHAAPQSVPGFPTRDDMEWLRQRAETRRPLSVEMINTAIAGRDYQIEAIRTILDAAEANRRKFLLVMATGTGKTRVAAALVETLMRAHWVKRVLFLVDRIALQEQALQAFKEHLPNSPRWPDEDAVDFDRHRRVYVTTYPTMLNLIHAGTTPATWISPFFFDLIIADESHRSLYNTYQQVITYFCSLTLGLTATPRDHVTHNTFSLFECADGEPTFAYTFAEAISHDPPYLCDFEVLNVRTKFQVQGIRGRRLDEPEREQLELEGFDPDAIDFEGTDLEEKVANSGTNALIVREFMEESIKDESGTLPGKSIMFACSVAHARRLQDIFDQMYPEHRGTLARVMVSDDSRVYGRGGLLDQFKTQDMPRVAISVDMLDTGVDIREVVNLVFAKPVYSYVKFWQMIGRGTRILDDNPSQRKPWCKAKDKFLIIDCWGNFDYFHMEPRGKEPGQQIPMPVRLFRARIDQLEAAYARGATDVVARVRADILADLAALPENNVVVLERQAELARVRSDRFWDRLGDTELQFLRQVIAPVLRSRPDAGAKALRLQTDVVELGTAILNGSVETITALRESITEQVRELPLSVNLVARERELIDAVLNGSWWADCDDAALRDLSSRLAPLMRFRQPRLGGAMVLLNLADLTAVRDRIVAGPDGRDLPVAQYRQRVEETIRAMVEANPLLQRLQNGETLSDGDLRALADLLRFQDPEIDEERLRQVYDVRTASFVQLLRHVLGVAPLERWSTRVTREFEEFIASHTTYSSLQIRFLQTLRTFVLQRQRLERQDLINAPFTRLHPTGVRGVFSPEEIDEVIRFAEALVA
ncbi:MAG: DEAD/DEAH box helicase family protein [Gemmatimonadales bacterium]